MPNLYIREGDMRTCDRGCTPSCGVNGEAAGRDAQPGRGQNAFNLTNWELSIPTTKPKTTTTKQ